jgi:serine/threonine protein phosphatase PrpC
MSKQRARVTYAHEQSPGAVSPEPPQQDKVYVEEMRTRGGLNLVLAVVVDGDGSLRAGEAAETFTNQLVSGISQSPNRDLNALLRDQVEGAAQFLTQANRSGEEIGEVAVTVVALHRGRLFFAHAGHTMALLVREGKTIRLTRPGDRLLGNSEAAVIQSGDLRGMTLQAGDRVVLTSDGLTRMNLEDGHPFVGLDEVATYVEGTTPLEAARHLISLALGRDVDDNVSAAVIQVSGKRGETPPVVIIGAGVLLAFILLGALGISRLRRNVDNPPPVDYGYAVLVHGSAGVMDDEGKQIVEVVGQLGTIPAGVRVTSRAETRLVLETTFEEFNELPGISLYLDYDAQIHLTLLDPHWDVSAAGDFERQPTTVIDLLSGRLMVVRNEGDREIHITWNGNTGILMGNEAGALGVSEEDGNLTVDCLRGNCKNILADGEAITFLGGQRALIIHGNQGEIENLPGETFQEWNDLCGGCLVDQ